ncbi:cytochrome P450 [Flavobacterium noncentrifugens]|uniref:Cytochrome P450 n=1 Tax=Flavobacterium noncentrifugens TaxID=1128970 RepID=A0A1G8RXM9_9FLAO|nr:cytochrome P450 [Flavobacterium noncentrifugens]GEP49622.1 cytochrome P450 [Flavobacterium noncentrifugens]SDJ21681.1 Cytochrome P450 [Flavobacterium noncentrifugens]
MPQKTDYNYPKQLSIVRFLLNAESIRKNPIPFHRKYFDAFGDTFSLKIGKTKHVILSRDNEVAQHLLQKHQKNYQKSELQTKFISKYLGHGLLTVNGDFWLRQRRLIQPAFHKQQMNQLVQNMQQTIVAELKNLPEDQTIALFPVMNRLAFNVVAKSLFHLSATEEKMNRLKQVISEVQEFLIKEIRVPYKALWFKWSGQVKKHQKMALESDAIILEIVEQRIQSNTKQNDLLDMLLETRYEDTGESMSMQQLIDEIKILFIAGHETTANALTFTLHLLGNHPEVQQKIHTELVATESETNDPIEQLQKMPYTNAVINESMRLYPPAWITDRENIADDELLGHNIKKGTLIGVSFYELHRNPKYWENPNAFIPERFLGDQKKQSLQYFYPFGAGPRMCIGAGFAMYEMSLALSHLVKKYTISTQNPDIQVNPLITLKPVGAEVVFSKR